MSTYQSFKTERLVLKPTDLADAKFLRTLMNTPKFISNIGDRKVYTVADAEKYIIEKMLPQLERLGYSNNTIIRRTDGVKIGSCGLYDRIGLKGVDLGFALLPRYEKMGYAYESAHKITQLAFEKFNVDSLSAITLPSNESSQSLLKKLNFSFEKKINLPNDPDDLMLFTLSAENYFEDNRQ